MNLYVNQTIIIHSLRVGGVSNSSVLQIGSAGIIKALSNAYNTGQYTGPAPEAGTTASTTPFVPLQPPE